MKKIMILIVSIFLLTGCETPEDKTNDVIDDLLKHSNFEMELLTEVTESIESNYSIMEGFGEFTLLPPELIGDVDINMYMNENETTYYRVTGYPDVLSTGRFVTSIVTSDTSINVYDLFVGKEITNDDLDEYMETIGYSPDDRFVGVVQRVYVNEHVYIRVYLENGVITGIRVEVDVTNEEGVIF